MTTAEFTTDLPLAGVRVVSFNHFLMGPLSAQILGDLGADVIAVEAPGGAFQRSYGLDNFHIDGQTAAFLMSGRNKRSLVLDLKSEEGLEVARDLIRRSDVMTENFRPGVLARLGLDWESVEKINPRIVYASGSGYGLSGPYLEKPGQDLLVQAMSGLARITGRDGEARSIGTSAVDVHGGTLIAMGVLAALLRRGTTGRGGRIDVSLLGSAIDLQLESFVNWFNNGKPEEIEMDGRVGGFIYPGPYGIYRAKDGEIAISVASVPGLAEVFGEPRLAEIGQSGNFRRRREISDLVALHLPRRTIAEWAPLFEQNQIWFTRVNHYADVEVDPQVVANRQFRTIPGHTGKDITLVGSPVNFDGAPLPTGRPPQPLGAQSREILEELGYDAAKVDRLAGTPASPQKVQ